MLDTFKQMRLKQLNRTCTIQSCDLAVGAVGAFHLVQRSISCYVAREKVACGFQHLQ